MGPAIPDCRGSDGHRGARNHAFRLAVVFVRPAHVAGAYGFRQGSEVSSQRGNQNLSGRRCLAFGLETARQENKIEAMKIFALFLILLANAVAFGQAPQKDQMPPGVAIRKYKWEKIGPAPQV